MSFPCAQAETCPSCPIATMAVGEQAVALALAEQAIQAKGEVLLGLMDRHDTESLLTQLEFNKSDGTHISERSAKPDTYARIATAFHRHFKPDNLKGNSNGKDF